MDISMLSIDQKLKLAENPKTAGEVLEKLANDEVQGIPGRYNEYFALRRNVAGNPNTPIQLLRRLAEDDEMDVRWEVAKNSSLPQDLIEAFSKIDGFIIAVASNEKCPSEILQVFSKIKDDDVREAVAANSRCPLSLLKKWARLKNVNIRASVASNSSAPIEILETLASDNEALVRMMLAGNLSCPKELLVRLSEDVDSDVRRCVAESKQCPAVVLSRLENDSDESVITAVAGNSNTPITTLKRLAVQERCAIRLAVADNPNCPPELRKMALTIPSCSFPINANLRDIMKPVLELKNLIEKARSEFPAHPFWNHYGIQDIDYCAPAWSLKICELPTLYTDRTRSMLEGPFFTSEKYPWPRGGDTPYASPVVQIDLSEISKLRGSDYGNGLLQVFIADSAFDIRVIPSTDIGKDQMTMFPLGCGEEYSGFCTDKAWLGDSGIVAQIVGYEEPVLSASIYADDGVPDDEDPEVIKEIFARMKLLSMNDSGIHMFGTFNPIQYAHSDVGGELFMALDSELCYGWGDSGSAQIFLNRSKDGSMSFTARWSCY